MTQEAVAPEYELGQVAILLREGDDVAVAKQKLKGGTIILNDGRAVRLRADVPPGHKFALREVAEGEPVRKFGQIIGYATAGIRPGDWVHTRNLGFGKGEGEGEGALHLEYEYSTDVPTVDYYGPEQQRTFPGYARPDGRVGTRNYVALISTVNCSASTVQAIADRFRSPEALRDFPGVDGVMAVTHKSGCGQHLGGPDYVQLQRTLAGMADHPNVAGYLLAGLGCEVNQSLALAQNQGLIKAEQIRAGRPQLPPVVVIQEAGGIRKAINRGVEETLKLLKKASEARRTPQPLSGLIVGTNCGGSDGNSGITANPALGMAGDEFVRHGAGWVLAETTETYGAEHLLTRRAVSRAVGEKLVALMRWWEWYTGIFGATIDANPAPGNKEGGLTTIYEKSLGAVAKGGTMPLVEVYKYAERIDKKGFTFMDTPGHDPVSVTGLVAGGCNLVAFTTGRGSCLGFKPAPVLKIATNSALYARMEDDMDIDAGVILSGVPIADVGRQIFEALVAVAGGQKTKSEAQGLGEAEFAPWMLGPVM
ncbi:MAG TPA: altronate dehydratase family protein [Chthonomonadaceae bacterium]|nr:altronate dehydratase family protein [Chthonomonadaceae bacterium]